MTTTKLDLRLYIEADRPWKLGKWASLVLISSYRQDVLYKKISAEQYAGKVVVGKLLANPLEYGIFTAEDIAQATANYADMCYPKQDVKAIIAEIEKMLESKNIGFSLHKRQNFIDVENRACENIIFGCTFEGWRGRKYLEFGIRLDAATPLLIHNEVHAIINDEQLRLDLTTYNAAVKRFEQLVKKYKSFFCAHIPEDKVIFSGTTEVEVDLCGLHFWLDASAIFICETTITSLNVNALDALFEYLGEYLEVGIYKEYDERYFQLTINLSAINE